VGNMLFQTNHRGENHVVSYSSKPHKKTKKGKTTLIGQMQCLEFFEKLAAVGFQVFFNEMSAVRNNAKRTPNFISKNSR
jgi:hypothetical protein